MRWIVSKIHQPKNIANVRQDTANNISPELLAVIEDFLQHKAVDPHKEAFSIEDFCRRYGISRTLAYDQINLGYLTARKPPDSDRTFILRADAQRWAEGSTVIPPTKAAG